MLVIIMLVDKKIDEQSIGTRAYRYNHEQSMIAEIYLLI